VLIDEAAQPVAATGGRSLWINGEMVAQGQSAWMLVSMNDKPLAQSDFLTATLMDGGNLRWRSHVQGPSAWVVEWRNRQAHTVAELPLRKVPDGWEVACPSVELVLICP
jgi:hypothetical protein